MLLYIHSAPLLVPLALTLEAVCAVDWEGVDLGSSPHSVSSMNLSPHLHNKGAGPDRELKPPRPTRAMVTAWSQWPLSPSVSQPRKETGPAPPGLAIFKRRWKCRFLYKMHALEKHCVGLSCAESSSFIHDLQELKRIQFNSYGKKLGNILQD